MIDTFYSKSCCKPRPLAGMTLRPTANKQTKKVCAQCLMNIKAAKNER